jgi:transposase-like protein
LQLLNELKSRGVEDVFTACVDGLKGLPEAIEGAFPNAERDFEWRLALSNKLKQSLEQQIREARGVRALKR